MICLSLSSIYFVDVFFLFNVVKKKLNLKPFKIMIMDVKEIFNAHKSIFFHLHNYLREIFFFHFIYIRPYIRSHTEYVNQEVDTGQGASLFFLCDRKENKSPFNLNKSNLIFILYSNKTFYTYLVLMKQ